MPRSKTLIDWDDWDSDYWDSDESDSIRDYDIRLRDDLFMM